MRGGRDGESVLTCTVVLGCPPLGFAEEAVPARGPDEKRAPSQAGMRKGLHSGGSCARSPSKYRPASVFPERSPCFSETLAGVTVWQHRQEPPQGAGPESGACRFNVDTPPQHPCSRRLIASHTTDRHPGINGIARSKSFQREKNDNYTRYNG